MRDGAGEVAVWTMMRSPGGSGAAEGEDSGELACSEDMGRDTDWRLWAKLQAFPLLLIPGEPLVPRLGGVGVGGDGVGCGAGSRGGDGGRPLQDRDLSACDGG